MPRISNVFEMQVFLLCLMFVGLITAKTRIVDEHARSSLSDLVLCVFLPCNILSSFLGTGVSQLSSLGIIFGISTGILGLTFLLSLVLYKKADQEQKKVLLYATLISNAGFLGNPVIESIYGLEGLTYASAYLVPVRVAIWTAGLVIFTGTKGSLTKVLLHPCLTASYMGILVMVTGFTPPDLIRRLIFSLGGCTTPVSMLVVGNVLGFVKIEKVISKLTVYFTFIRLILVPLLVMGILLILRPDPVISGISVILSGMPAAVTTVMLAEKYNADKELASKIVFVSTLLSIFTAPLLAWLLVTVL